MRRGTLEPGLLQVFRWLMGVRLAFSLLGLLLKLLPAEQRVLRYPMLGILEAVLLLGYLSWPLLRRSLGRVYLPIALFVASAGPIFEQALTVTLRLLSGVPPADAIQDVYLLFFVLFVPLILTAWQYDLWAVASFCGGTALLDLVLYLPLAVRGGVPYAGIFGQVFIRSLLFGLVGYVVVRLVRAQREQRAELARANAQLAHYATTLEQLTISRERNRLARELHDTLAHTLSGVAVQLEAARSLWDSDPPAAREMMERSLSETRDGLREARRAIHALRATPLEDLGLGLALRNLARSVAERADLSLDLQVPEQVGEITPPVEQAVYRIAEEALANVARHADARHLAVELECRRDQIVLSVADDGRGFDAAPSTDGRYGLQGMRERAEVVGGTLTIESEPGAGTTVRLVVEAGA